MPEELPKVSTRFKFPPIEHAIWEEIADLLPDGHLKTYWEGLAKIQEIPKDDPMIVAILAMGIVTIAARQVPAEIAELVENIRGLLRGNLVPQNLASDEAARRIEKTRLDEIRGNLRDTLRDLTGLRNEVRWAQENILRFRNTLDKIVEANVEKVIADKSYFDRRPRAIAYVACIAMAVGIVLGFALSHWTT